MSQKKIQFLPIFDTAENLPFDPSFPPYLSHSTDREKDFKGCHAFLYAYKGVNTTYNAYRREVERLLHWCWQIESAPLLSLTRQEIEHYLAFCQNPPETWIGTKKPARFIDEGGCRRPNAEWRPFVVTVSKHASRLGDKPDKANYQLSEKAIKEIFIVLGSFFNFLIQEGYTEINPLSQIRQKSKYYRKEQSHSPIRRLSELQWNYVIETARQLADKDSQHERTLFIMSALYAMYLRISELVASSRWSPKMSDFKQDNEGNWWFFTVGKGNKGRQIAVSHAMLCALKRWRLALSLPPLPTPDDNSALVPRVRGKGNLTSTNQIRNIVQYCFDLAILEMKEEGFLDEAATLSTATVHWLRHTGISDDVKHRPREHVRDDAGHYSSQTTDKYIDVGLHERHGSAKNKTIEK